MNAHSFRMVMLIALLVSPSFAGDVLPPQQNLWPDKPPRYFAHDEAESIKERSKDIRIINRQVKNVTIPTYSIFPPARHAPRSDMAVIICPGGGYRILAIDKEGYDLATWFNRQGITAIVLKYRTKPFIEGDENDPFPPLLDIQRAIRTIRHRANELEINPNRIGVMGFSAGGHLALLAGAVNDDGNPKSADPIEHHSSRPDFLMPIYPGVPRELRENVSPELPPTFTTITYDDFLMQGNLEFLTAALKSKPHLEYHIFPRGGHGYGMGVRGGRIQRWPGLLESWLTEVAAKVEPYQPVVTRPIPKEEGFVLRVNCGHARDWQDDKGRIWQGDWQQQCDGRVAVRSSDLAIETSPTLQHIYRTERYGASHYTFDVPNGTYTVLLHFAETWDGATKPGDRVFSVAIQDKPVLTDFDVFAEAGNKRNIALVRGYTAKVTDGKLTITFEAKVNAALINGIEIVTPSHPIKINGKEAFSPVPLP